MAVVTRIDFYAFQQGDIWGGNILYDISTADQQINALADFTSNGTYDEYASLISTFVYQPAIGPLVVNNIVYTKAVANPPVYQHLTAIEPQFLSTMRITNITDVATETLAPTTHLRYVFLSFFSCIRAFVNDVVNSF